MTDHYDADGVRVLPGEPFFPERMPEQQPTIHYASQSPTEQRAIAADIRAELARLEADDDNPEPPW